MKCVGLFTELTSDIISRAQSLISALHILEVIAPSLATPLHVKILSLLPCLLQVLCSPFTAIRHMSARAMCSLIQVDLHHTMQACTCACACACDLLFSLPQFMVAEVLPFLGATSSAAHRQGAIEVLSCVLEGVGLGVLCYVVLLLMPVLGTMSDQMLQVRHMATRCFGTLVTLMPLEVSQPLSCAPSPPRVIPSPWPPSLVLPHPHRCLQTWLNADRRRGSFWSSYWTRVR